MGKKKREGETARSKEPKEVKAAKEQARIKALRTADQVRKEAGLPPRLLQRHTLPKDYVDSEEQSSAIAPLVGCVPLHKTHLDI